jgi:hypothetical protein
MEFFDPNGMLRTVMFGDEEELREMRDYYQGKPPRVDHFCRLYSPRSTEMVEKYDKVTPPPTPTNRRSARLATASPSKSSGTQSVEVGPLRVQEAEGRSKAERGSPRKSKKARREILLDEEPSPDESNNAGKSMEFALKATDLRVFEQDGIARLLPTM